MKNLLLSLLLLLMQASGIIAQNIGINTSSPDEKLHIKDGNLLITGPNFIGADAAIIGSQVVGTKFLWISNRAALRAGRLLDTEWHSDSIGAYSLAFGTNVNAPGYASAVFGAGSRTGYYAFAAGYHNSALADNATAFGSYNRVDGRGGSLVAGEYNISKSYAVTVLGRYNDTTNMTSAISMGANNPFFVVGNGTANNARSNAMVVMNNGRVGIGNNLPGATLDIQASSGIPQQRLRSTGNDFVRIRMSNTVNTNPYWDMASITHASISTNARMNFFYSQSGGSGIDVLSLHGNGNAVLAGVLTQNSDARLKKNIESISLALPLLQQLGGYHYQWKDEKRDQGIQTGLLAQEVEKIMPELVIEDSKGVKSVNYNGLVPYLLEAIKELKEEVDVLKKNR